MFAKDANILTKLKEAAHNTIWAFCQTNLMNAYDASTSYQSVMTWWKMAYMAAIATTGVLFVGMCAAYVVCYQKSRKENG